MASPVVRLTARAGRLNLRAVRAIVLAVLSVVCVGAAVLTTPIRVVGTVFSIAAPALALAGVILGGLEIAERKRAGQPRDAALIGVVLSALSFFPALATTLTCGVCNALWSSAPNQLSDPQWLLRHAPVPAVRFPDGGPGALPPPPLAAPGRVRPDGGVAAGEQSDAAAAPPVIPPPPLPAGPRRP